MCVNQFPPFSLLMTYYITVHSPYNTCRLLRESFTLIMISFIIQAAYTVDGIFSPLFNAALIITTVTRVCYKPIFFLPFSTM